MEPATQQRLAIQGMHCAGCVARVEDAVRDVPGVASVSVSLIDASAVIGGAASPGKLVRAVRQAGYTATPVERDQSVAERRAALDLRQSQAIQKWRRRVLLGLAIWPPLEFVHWFGPGMGIDPHGPALLWITVILGTLVFAYSGSAFFVSAARAALTRSTNMDTLVSVGALSAYGLSLAGLVGRMSGASDHVPLYFVEIAALLTLIGLGHWLEARATGAAGGALRDLLDLQPSRVRRLATVDDTEGADIDSETVEPGELLLVRAGERVAVDGVIERGTTSLDESVVTGESMPVERGPGSPVVAGAANLSAQIVVRATTDGRSTTVARIASMVTGAMGAKMRVQRLADRIAGIFVPGVLVIAALTFALWAGLGSGGWTEALIIATTVLVISCPCALGLATPTAVMAGAGAASKRGLLIRSGTALERSAGLTVMLFDKTGTLTVGRPRVVDADDRTLEHAVSLAIASTHPLSRAIVEAAGTRGITKKPAEDVKEEAGKGLVGRVEDREIRLISARHAVETGLMDAVPDRTTSVVLVDNTMVGAILFDDEARPDARDLLSQLASRGIEAGLLTGDHLAAATRLADQIGLREDSVRAGLSPDEKVEEVMRRAAGATVAMVGDGLNDAPALAAAGAQGGLGIAMATGTNIAIDSADVVVPGDRLTSVLDLLDIGRQTLRTVHQNLFLSLVYNAVAIPAAALGLLGTKGPVIAAGAMAVSSLSVVGNSVRLRWRLERRRRVAAGT